MSSELLVVSSASSLPTRDPRTAGLLWNDRGIVKI